MTMVLCGTPTGLNIWQRGEELEVISGCCGRVLHYNGSEGHWYCSGCAVIRRHEPESMWASVYKAYGERRYSVEAWVANWTGFEEADITVVVKT